jgi:AcrR family transcriptional regulator
MTQKKAPNGVHQMRKTKRPPTYHHGSLRQALLQGAERILERDGLQGLTIRAAAREAGVSHAAPKHHFGDLTGLFSELAAMGYERLTSTLESVSARDDGLPINRKVEGMAREYVAFARKYPGLFLLMYRSERLDGSQPSLRAAIERARKMPSSALVGRRSRAAGSTVPQVAGMVGAWSLAHGFAMLLLDGRMRGLTSTLPPDTSVDAILDGAISWIRTNL